VFAEEMMQFMLEVEVRAAKNQIDEVKLSPDLSLALLCR
jgi:hypothetical protein